MRSDCRGFIKWARPRDHCSFPTEPLRCHETTRGISCMGGRERSTGKEGARRSEREKREKERKGGEKEGAERGSCRREHALSRLCSQEGRPLAWLPRKRIGSSQKG